MRIFIFLNFFCLQKNTFLTEINGVFIFSCFAFFSKIILMRFSNFLWSFFTSKKSIFNAKMKFPKIPKVPKMPKMPKIPTKILTAMGSYRGDPVYAEIDTDGEPLMKPSDTYGIRCFRLPAVFPVVLSFLPSPS